MVCFYLGCSFGFEGSLKEAGIPVRNVEQGTNVSMYKVCDWQACQTAHFQIWNVRMFDHCFVRIQRPKTDMKQSNQPENRPCVPVCICRPEQWVILSESLANTN